MKIENYTVGVEGIPICIGHENHCLKMQPAAWLSVVENDPYKESKKKLFLLQAFRFHKVINTNDITNHPPDLPMHPANSCKNQ